MLDQGADGSGEHFSIVALFLPAWLMATEFLGPPDDRRDGDVDAILVQAVSESV